MPRERPSVDSNELRDLLATRPPAVAEMIRQRLLDLRPCVIFETTRLSPRPMRGTLVDRLLRRPGPGAVLTPTASKFGGTPYMEREGELDGGRFLGQVNFADVTTALQREGAVVPAGMPTVGLLAVDLTGPMIGNGRIRWYPDPHDTKALPPASVDWVARYEARANFRASWSLRGLEWFDGLDDDQGLWEWMNDLEVSGIDEDARTGHKLFGHPNESLNEHYGFTPTHGRSHSIREYALLWRIDCDRAADLAWGTNWLYVLIHKNDLEAGALDRAVLTGANA